MSLRVSVITFGCRVNQADSCRFEEELRSRGATVASPEEADLVVVNTCSVTASADQGSRQVIRRIARRNPAAKIVVTGCYATRKPEEVRALPGVVRLFRNDEKDRLVPVVVEEVARTTAQRFDAGNGPCGDVLQPGVLGRTAYPLRIQTGCDEPCSYCIIPTTRGAPRSLPPDRVRADVERLLRGGFKEIILTGVHLGSYGRDLTPPLSLSGLLRELGSIDRDVLFRISSLEPMDCTDEIVDLVASTSALAPHFHLPLQHASDRILSLMRRPYTLAFYRRLVDRIRALMPHASIGSDVIVGFPGETHEDFELLRDYLEDSPLTHVHVFPYSDRPGTVASTLGGKVGGIEIRGRSAVLRAIGQQLTTRFRTSQVGSIRPGLTIDDGSVAVTDNYLKLRIGHGHVRNERVMVRVLTDSDPMVGDAIGAPSEGGSRLAAPHHLSIAGV
ncbi:MAG: MiaB/RimO family radical SAM methylthiotransferase [Acidobacteria bacterium]|nr:MiaB/RimO family radical SAM methylthiotransferase [Acidobacteriota bacterium]